MNEIVTQNAKGESTLILVLEPGNLFLLKQGNPIQKHLEAYFPDGIPKKLELVILFSETPNADAKEFAKMAQVVLDERSSVNQLRRPHCPECKSTIEQFVIMKNESPVS